MVLSLTTTCQLLNIYRHQNLKYLGLLAMSKILNTHPKSVQGHKDLVMQCLDDSDESIRLRALDLLCGMVSKKNLLEIVKKLMVHMDKAEGTTYRYDNLIPHTQFPGSTSLVITFIFFLVSN